MTRISTMLAGLAVMAGLLYLSVYRTVDRVDPVTSTANREADRYHEQAVAAPGQTESAVQATGTAPTAVKAEAHDNARLYMWKAKEHVTVISMEPPADGRDVRIVLYGKETESSMAGSAVRGPLDRNEPVDGTVSPGFADDPVRVYTPDGLREFIQYSRQIGEKIELRGKELEQLVELL